MLMREWWTILYSHKQCLEKYGSPHFLRKALKSGELHQIEKGIYSDSGIHVSTMAVLAAKYPKAIVTMDTAFYYHGLTDVIPDEYYIATPESSRALRDPRIKQVFENGSIFGVGATVMERQDATFKIYGRERMLIELLRYKNKLPYDYYKEILGNYRALIGKLDIELIQEYAETFPKHKMICNALEAEVF